MVEPDSYVFVSVAGCETMRVSFDYDTDAGFSMLESYDWMPVQDARTGDSGIQSESQLHEWVTDAVDRKLAEQGFRLDRETPDFLVSYDAPLEMQGTLSLTVNDANTRQFIWRGQSSDEAYPARNPAAWEKRIRTAVDKLLEEFPPIRDE
ncbi:MAG: DUF4136 domain-containing protein [Gammaproteobacteria bacterium]|nr:MAG: DUF4136 domain-containing protein [Gammaproteobacteria bacterium]